MSRRTLRTALAAVLLAALLLPASAAAREPTRLEPSAELGLSAFWDFLDTLFLKTGTDNGWQIDPNGAAAATCDNRWGIDPNGGASCVTSDNRWTIDPNG